MNNSNANETNDMSTKSQLCEDRRESLDCTMAETLVEDNRSSFVFPTTTTNIASVSSDQMRAVTTDSFPAATATTSSTKTTGKQISGEGDVQAGMFNTGKEENSSSDHGEDNTASYYSSFANNVFVSDGTIADTTGVNTSIKQLEESSGNLRKSHGRDLIKRREQNRVASQRYRERRKQKGEEIKNVVSELHYLKERAAYVDENERHLKRWESQLREREEAVVQKELESRGHKRDLEQPLTTTAISEAATTVLNEGVLEGVAIKRMMRQVKTTWADLQNRQKQEMEGQLQVIRLLVKALVTVSEEAHMAGSSQREANCHGFSTSQLNMACQIALQSLVDAGSRWQSEEETVLRSLGLAANPRRSTLLLFPGAASSSQQQILNFTSLRAGFGLLDSQQTSGQSNQPTQGKSMLGWLNAFARILGLNPKQVVSMTEVEKQLCQMLAPFVRHRMLTCLQHCTPFQAVNELHRACLASDPTAEVTLQMTLMKCAFTFVEHCSKPDFVCMIPSNLDIPDDDEDLQRQIFEITSSAFRLWFSFLNPMQRCKLILVIPRKLNPPMQLCDVAPSLCPFFLDLLLKMQNGQNPVDGNKTGLQLLASNLL